MTFVIFKRTASIRCQALGLFAVGLTFAIVGRETNAQPANDGAESRLARPEPNADLRVEKLSPELETILKNWERSSNQIQTLQGRHYRWVYNLVFNVEKRSEGVFYYKSPDKGRIDLDGRQPAPDEVSQRKDSKTGAPFTIQADHPEKWICDGKVVWQIDEEKKTAEQFAIPPKQQGKNIIDGPLPFLFGMSADKAEKRYSFRLLRDTVNEVWLEVTPRWKQDAANYRQATVVLDKATYLPKAVRLIDPPGSTETAFRFEELEVNHKDNIFQRLLPGAKRDPFDPDLRGYKMINKVIAGKKPEQPADTPVVPSVLSFQWQTARSLLEKAGYKVEFKRGETAVREELVYVVYRQDPEPKVPLQKGGVVTLTLYDKVAAPSSSTVR